MSGGDGLLGVGYPSVVVTNTKPLKLIEIKACPRGIETKNGHCIRVHSNTALEWPINIRPLSTIKETRAYDYAAALVLVHKVLFNTLLREKGVFIYSDVDAHNDSIDLLEKQILCILANMPTRSKSLSELFPLYREGMGPDAREYFYSQKPLSWKFYLDNKAPNESAEEKKLLAQKEMYKTILLKMYSLLAEASAKKTCTDNTTNQVIAMENLRVIEENVMMASPVALCEARVLNLASRLQIQRKVFPKITEQLIKHSEQLIKDPDGASVFNSWIRRLIEIYSY